MAPKILEVMNEIIKPNIGVSDQHREGVIQILNTVLSDEFVLYTTTRNFHWNVVGMQFSELHAFFDAQYQELNTVVDKVAERTRSLGGRALGTLAEFVEHTRLKERPEPRDSQNMIAALLSDHEDVIRHLRSDSNACGEKYQDKGTDDFLTGLMKQHEKMAWMLRAFLDSAPA
jgi:starvation-inducible DNA-binding protein